MQVVAVREAIIETQSRNLNKRFMAAPSSVVTYYRDRILPVPNAMSLQVCIRLALFIGITFLT